MQYLFCLYKILRRIPEYYCFFKILIMTSRTHHKSIEQNSFKNGSGHTCLPEFKALLWGEKKEPQDPVLTTANKFDNRLLKLTFSTCLWYIIIPFILGNSYIHTSHLDHFYSSSLSSLSQIPFPSPKNYLSVFHLSFYFILKLFIFWIFNGRETMKYLTFCVWFTLLSIMFSESNPFS